jgi:nifR3 family TIM-barrel protein
MIGPVPIYGPAILAPLAGYSDSPYRRICREYGSAMSYTEFVSAYSVLHANAQTLHMLHFDPVERPIVFQIFGSREDVLAEAACRLEQLGPDVIDVNMGCAAHKVVDHGSGASLLQDPAKIGRIFARLTRALTVPVTGKIRLGWDEQSCNYGLVARILEENGAALIAVHARTRAQNYGTPAVWDAIAQVKQTVSIPVLGNGDVQTAADIERMMEHTGCDGVLIGRAAIGNPWIFQRRAAEQVGVAERMDMIYRHLDAMLDFYGPERGLIHFRKHVVKYLRGLPNAAALKDQLLRCTSRADFIAACQAYPANLHTIE